MNTTSIYQDIRSVLFPERRWQYVFHLIVLLFSSAYWIGSYAKLPDSSMAEMVMYRPDGDTELYSAITALSRLNFGEIQDAGTYGHGLTSFPVISLAPHALKAIHCLADAGVRSTSQNLPTMGATEPIGFARAASIALATGQIRGFLVCRGNRFRRV